ncbi:MAG: hypothetical protein HFH14_10820 [Lachnospiraceae bacterium]|nr:hypothetical protein [Lachnospiraceae bacterium]
MTADKSGRLSANYKASSILDAAVEYYIFYEMGNETPFPEQSDADAEISVIRECFKKISGDENGGISDMLGRLDDARNIIIKKMQVLTAYIDRFLVYEYVMNRIEARYTKTEQEIDDLLGKVDKDALTGDIIDFIFSTKEPAEVNDRVRDIIGQLPVRMSRSKFLNYVKDSIKLYSDSDRDSLDGFVYMIRTSAMLYEPDGMNNYFSVFEKVLDELGEADFTCMETDYYNILSDKIQVSTSQIHDISDLYMSLQRMINGLYVYALNANTVLDDKDSNIFNACIDIIDAVDGALDEGCEPDADSLFERIEGALERLYEDRIVLEAMLGKEISVEDKGFAVLKKSERLMSSSIFAELDEKPSSGPVTPEYLEEVTDSLLKDMQAMIKKYSRPVVRAVYSVILSSIPVFFGNSDELTEYIRHSIEQCADKAELVACYELLCDLIMDDFITDGD